tara:strand:- start:21010 stop:21723 length:714 start_codon:yes stop_codon:yes gene_type:complete
MKKTALIIIHQSSVHLGSFTNVLKQNDFDVQPVYTYKDDITVIDPLAHDVVVMLGGSFGVYNQNEFPVLKNELAFLKARIAADKPTIGICLGSQMIAAALGAKVYVGEKGQEFGWLPLTATDAGQNSPIKHLDSAHTQMFFSHGDTFDLPEGAVLLASSELYKNQAYSYGKNIIATQFHPEVETDIVEEFLIKHANDLSGPNPIADVHQIRIDTKNYIDTLKTQTSKFLNEWLHSVA